MTVRRFKYRWVAALAVLLLVAAACGDDDDTTDTTASSAAAGAGSTAAPGEGTTAASTGGAAAGSLKDICPNPMVIQTDWFPEADHGWTYQLIGPNGTQDAKKGVYSGPLLDGTTDTGITLEVRAGGPFIGQSTATKQLYDSGAFAAYVDTGDAVRSAGTQPVVGVFGSYDKGPQIVMWNPEVFADLKDWSGVKATGATVLHFPAAYMDYLIGKGLVDKAQADSNYDGSPGRFVSGDKIIQQGFATNEIYKYENDIAEWKKPVKYLLTHDAGFQIYQSALSVKPETLKDKADCLKAAVPIFQRALVAYMTDPKPVNDMLTKYVTAMDQFWKISDAGNADAVQKMKDLKLVSDGGDKILGNFDCDRIQKLIDEFVPIEKANNVEGIKEGLKCADVATNEFIDTSISIGY